MTELHSVGLPHSVIRGSQDVCSSPRLFAAYHDLLRRIAPRHPPWTLVRLTIFLLHPLTLTCSLNRGSLPAAHTRTLSASLSTLPRASGLLFPFPYLSKNNAQRASALLLEVWGFEPQTYGLQSHRSDQLSYTPGSRTPEDKTNNRQNTVVRFTIGCGWPPSLARALEHIIRREGNGVGSAG